MKILYIDTTTSYLYTGLVVDKKLVSEVKKDLGKDLSSYTLKEIDTMLKQNHLEPNDIDKIIVVNGPGSFTGIRVGVTIAKTYAYLKKIPLTAVSSLKMLALSKEGETILSLIDAKHNHYYLGLYNKEKKEIIKEHFANKDEVLEIIEKYHPVIVSNKEINNEEIKSSKQKQDVSKIISYYQNEQEDNYFTIKPNYLKLPQALEDRHD